jgi:DegV family protein with EDD domain
VAARVVTDSTSYLPGELVARYGIEVVSLHVTFAEGDSLPEVELSPRAFYSRLASTPGLPRSSQPPTAELEALFRRHVEAGHEVVGVFLSSEMSGTFAGAESARDAVLRDLPDAVIELVDSRSNCMQLGFTALAAAEAAEAALPAIACADAARHVVPRSRFLFTPATLEYLQRGGRIGRASALFGSMLQVRPILTVADGVTSVVKKVRTQRKAIEEIVSLAEADLDRHGLVDVCVHHIDAEEPAREVAAAFAERLGRDVPLVPIGAVIGTHVGPGALGVVYRTREVQGRVGEA